MRSNEEFLNDMRKLYGEEGYEEFISSDIGLKMKQYKDGGVSLDMLYEITTYLKNQIEVLKELSIRDPNNMRALIRGLTFEMIVVMFNKQLHGDILDILYIVDEGIIETVLDEDDTDEL